jgi:hypothetical protein
MGNHLCWARVLDLPDFFIFSCGIEKLSLGDLTSIPLPAMSIRGVHRSA